MARLVRIAVAAEEKSKAIIIAPEVGTSIPINVKSDQIYLLILLTTAALLLIVTRIDSGVTMSCRVRRVFCFCAAAIISASALSSPAAAAETIEYTYDARGRLIEVKRIQPSGNVKTKYEYDRADNRTKKEVTPAP